MDKPVSELTYEVIAYSVVPYFNWDDVVDWAYEMLLLGYDTPNLVILAGVTKPTCREECIRYLSEALNELGLKAKEGEEAVICYSRFLVNSITTRACVKTDLSGLYRLYHRYEAPMLWDFCLLYWAWEDIDYGEGFQHYWNGATKDNIESIVVEEAKKWLMVYGNQSLI